MVLKDLVQATLNSATDVPDYIDTIKKNYQRLMSIGATVPEWMLVGFLIFGLSKEYNTLVTVLENASRKEELTFDEAVASLLEESCQKALHEDPVALLTRTLKSANASKEGTVCNYCHKEGHTKEQCWKLHPEFCPKKSKMLKRKQKGRPQNKSIRTEAYMASTHQADHLM